MIQDAFWGILIPFLGTSLGAGCVFFLKKSLSDGIQRALTGFAAGVMVAASVWSLLIPAMEQAADLGRLAFFPAAVGFWLGILFLLLLDHLIPHLHQNSLQAEGPKSQLQRTTMMVLAVTLHNIPEGMAVGVVYAGYLAGTAQITAAGALALSLGIAIQNFPEGAIISMPLRAEGMKKGRAFWGGVLSGIVEPIGAVLTILAAGIVVPALPYLLSFAAGAMLYVVVEELVPQAHSKAGTCGFVGGFLIMMILDERWDSVSKRKLTLSPEKKSAIIGPAHQTHAKENKYGYKIQRQRKLRGVTRPDGNRQHCRGFAEASAHQG